MATQTKRTQIHTDVTTLDIILDQMIIPYLNKERAHEEDTEEIHLPNL